MTRHPHSRRVYSFLCFFIVLGFASCGQARQGSDHLSGLLSKEEIERDFAQLTATIASDVPFPFYSCPKSKYDSVKENIRRNIPDSADAKTVFRLFYPLVQALNDAHFSLRLPDDHFPDSTAYFPFKVVIQGDRIFVKENLSADSSILKGDEIMAIDALRVKDVIAAMRSCSFTLPGETLFFEKWYERRYYKRLAALFDVKSPYTITLATGRQFSTQGVSERRFQRTGEAKNEPTFSLLEGNIGYLKLPSLSFAKPADRQQFGEKVDSAFTFFQKEGIDKLIIDIRGNMGGSTLLAKDVLDYVYAAPYTLGLGEIFLKDGAVKENRDGTLHTPKPRANRFTGETLLLNDVLTYSSGHMMQVGFQYYKMGQTMGEVSSEPLFITGEVKQIALGRSGLLFNYGASNFILPGFTAGERSFYTPGVTHIPTLSERLGEEDELLKRAIGEMASR